VRARRRGRAVRGQDVGSEIGRLPGPDQDHFPKCRAMNGAAMPVAVRTAVFDMFALLWLALMGALGIGRGLAESQFK